MAPTPTPIYVATPVPDPTLAASESTATIAEQTVPYYPTAPAYVTSTTSSATSGPTYLSKESGITGSSTGTAKLPEPTYPRYVESSTQQPVPYSRPQGVLGSGSAATSSAARALAARGIYSGGVPLTARGFSEPTFSGKLLSSQAAASSLNQGAIEAPRELSSGEPERLAEDKLKESGSGLGQAYHDLGYRAFKEGNFTEAIKNFEEAVRLEPQSVEIHNNFGLALLEAGKLTEARDHFTEALKINPDDSATKQNLDKALALLGESAGTTVSAQSAK